MTTATRKSIFADDESIKIDAVHRNTDSKWKKRAQVSRNTVVDCVLEWCRAKRWRHLLDLACFVVVCYSGGLRMNHGTE